MSQRVRQNCSHGEENYQRNISSETLCSGCLNSDTICGVDWTTLPDDTVTQLFSYLNYRDRASLASTCRTFRLLGSFPCLWGSLDLRSYKFDTAAAVSLSSRCKNLRRLKLRAADSADAIITLQARELQEISCDLCRDITDVALSVIAARHEMLESIQLGPDHCEQISSEAIKVLAYCCPRLKRLWMSGVREANGDAINALAKHCRQLMDIGFLESNNIDEVALGNLSSLKFLSVAGTRNLKWGSAAQVWSKLPNLVGLDVSRTDVNPSVATSLFSSSQNLKVLTALNCPSFEDEVDRNKMHNHTGRILLTLFSDILKGVASLFADNLENVIDVFRHWKKIKNEDKNLDEIVVWIERTISHSLFCIAKNNLKKFDDFWLNQGAAVLLSLLQSSQEEVQERAATAVAIFLVIHNKNATIDCQRAEAILRGDGVRMLLNLARSCQESLQSKVVKAIANLSVDSKVAKVVADSGGINVLTGLARSKNRLVAEEAARALWDLSVVVELKGAIAEAGGVTALVDLILKWPSGHDLLIQRATGALANLATDEKCSREVALAGGIHALVMLARACKFEGVQEQAARALSNLAAYGDCDSNSAAIGQEEGALESLVQLTYSQNEGVRQQVATALWNLSFDEKNREVISAVGGIEALVALARSSISASKSLQERAAGALWALLLSETNRIAIGRQGGIAPLIVLARSDVEDIHLLAAGALWNLAFYRDNALRIIQDDGVQPLVHLCSSSNSKMARFMAALALVYMFDGIVDAAVPVGSSPSSLGSLKMKNIDEVGRLALKHVEEFVISSFNPKAFNAAVAATLVPTALAQIAEAIRIPDAEHVRCSGAEIDRFVRMLGDSCSILQSCSAFALLQFTLPGGRYTMHHSSLLEKAGVGRVLRDMAEASKGAIQVIIFTKIVLQNLENTMRSQVSALK